MHTFRLYFLGIILCTVTVSSQINPPVAQCYYNDYECYRRTAQHFIQTFGATGLPALNIRPFDPLPFEVLYVERNYTNPISVELTIRDGVVLGLGNMDVLAVRGLDPQISENLEMQLFIPFVAVKGTYTINGVVYGEPIVGAGDFELVLENAYTYGVGITKPVQRSGHTYIQFDEVQVVKRPERAFFKLTGLHNGKQILALLNYDGVETYRQLGPGLERAKALLFKQILNDLFATLPYRKFFL